MSALSPRSTATTDPIRSPTASAVYGLPVATLLARSRPSIEGALAAASRRVRSSTPEPIATGIAPRSRRWRVSRLVSTSVRATTPLSWRKAARDPSARQFECRRESDRITNPATAGIGL